MNASDSSNNLIVLFGRNGAGKTRMLKTIESHVPASLVERLGAESMVDELVASLRRGLINGEPLERFEKIYTLLVDNLWVLAARPRAAEYVAALLKERQREGRLTVVASDLSTEQWAEKQPVIAEMLCGSVRVEMS